MIYRTTKPETCYAYAMGMTENIIGIMVAIRALFGILGTFAYPKIKSRYGIHKAGVIALIAQISCLSLCIFSFWLPGSHWFQSNATKYSKAVIDKINNSSNIDSVNNNSRNFQNYTAKTFDSITKFESKKIQMVLTEDNNLGGWQEKMRETFVRNMSHIWLFLFGIVLSRLGLWMADLTLNQILQECVVENQKGIINGIQHSLIMIFENVKYAAVIILPSTSTFGWLVILSFLSIFTALLCFLKYVSQVKKSNLVQQIPYLQYQEKSKPFSAIRELLLLPLRSERNKTTESNTNFEFSKTGSLFSKSEQPKQSNQYEKQQTPNMLEKKDSMTQSVYDPIMTIPCKKQATK